MTTNKESTYAQGWNARILGYRERNCPYRRGTTGWDDWIEGYRDAKHSSYAMMYGEAEDSQEHPRT
jgi:ribosome modulation factor